MTVQDCFDAAVRLESLLRNLYLDLARCFSGQPPAAAAFRTLASGVEQRALRIRLIALRRRSVTPIEDSPEKVSEDVVAMLVELAAMAENIRHDPDSGSALRVLRRVIDVERRCHAVHAEVLRHSSDPVVLGLFSSLALRDHDQERVLARVVQATRRGRVTSPARRHGGAPVWAGGGSFAVARMARERASPGGYLAGQ